MMVNLKCPAMYGRINGLGEHDIVVGEIDVRRGRSKRVGIALDRITSSCGNVEAVLPAEAIVFLSYHT
jgi:hypothetical protein